MSFFNFISYPPHCGDNLVLPRVFLHLAPQTPDMYHDRIVGLIYLFVPHLLEYLIRAEHAARIGRQKIEDIEFDGRQPRMVISLPAFSFTALLGFSCV